MSPRRSHGAFDPDDPEAGGRPPESFDAPAGPDAGVPPARAPRHPSRWRWKLVAAALVVAVFAGAVAAYRSWQERRIVALSVARARQLVRSDTWLGYREAAALLEVRAARVEPLQAGSLRALALAMLALDYRDPGAAADARTLLVAPERAPSVPAAAEVAAAAAALSRGEIGTAVNHAGRAPEAALAHVLRARAALAADNPAAAAEAIDHALAIDGSLPAALALRGDALRRAGRAAEARTSYLAAIDGSSRALRAGLAGSGPEGAAAPHARAVLGLAKLALSRQLDPAEATKPLAALLHDSPGTPGVERARAGLHLAALQARAGDRAAAASAIAAAPVDVPGRAWIERAAGLEEVERGPYRVVEPPPTLASASDDDRYVPPPPPPPPEARPPPKYPAGFKIHGAPKRAKHRASAQRAAGR